MRAYQILNETKTTLSALYKNGFPDRDEEFWNEVTRSDLDIPLEINKIAPYKLGIILTSQYRIEHIDELVLKGEQKRVVNQYRKDPNLSDSIIVMSDGRIIDGNHRALAAYLTKRPINYVDLNDLAEITEDEDYRIDHRAPMHDSGSPLYDVTGTYPDDIYGPKAIQYYGTREPWDSRSIRVIQLSRNKPNQTIQIFRAVPKEVKSNTINPGDWVTASKEYAAQHGRGLGKYKVLTKIVPAKTLFTNGDSIHEWGYDPGGAAPPVAENFADGKGPGRPGDSVRHGIPKNATMAELEKASHSAGRKGQLARWQLNMRRGKAELSEIKQRLDAKCWQGKRKEGTKIKGGIRVNNCVPVSETGVKKPQLKTYAARVKLKQSGYTNIVDATVMARNPEMARRLLHQLYGGNSSVVGQPREIK